MHFAQLTRGRQLPGAYIILQIPNQAKPNPTSGHAADAHEHHGCRRGRAECAAPCTCARRCPRPRHRPLRQLLPMLTRLPRTGPTGAPARAPGAAITSQLVDALNTITEWYECSSYAFCLRYMSAVQKAPSCRSSLQCMQNSDPCALQLCKRLHKKHHALGA